MQRAGRWTSGLYASGLLAAVAAYFVPVRHPDLPFAHFSMILMGGVAVTAFLYLQRNRAGGAFIVVALTGGLALIAAAAWAMGGGASLSHFYVLYLLAACLYLRPGTALALSALVAALNAWPAVAAGDPALLRQVLVEGLVLTAVGVAAALFISEVEAQDQERTAMDVLAAAGDAFTSPEPGVVCQAAVQTGRRLMDAEEVLLFLLPRDSIEPAIAVRGQHRGLLDDGTVAFMQGMATRAAAGGHAITDWHAAWHLAAVPLQVQARTVGVLVTARGRIYREADLRCLRLLGHQSGLALHHAQLCHHLVSAAVTGIEPGLHQARRLQEHLEREIEVAESSGRPLAVAMVDSDSLQAINESAGHEAGDEVMRQLGYLLRSNMRGSDVVVRGSGDEFVVILPGTRAEDAAQVLDRVRQRMAASTIRVGGRDLQVTISAGIAAYPLAARTPDALLKAADAAMYEAKAMGKNRVTIARKEIGVAS